MQDLASIELTLQNQNWIGGQTPSSSDCTTFQNIKNVEIKTSEYPFTYAWKLLVTKFDEKVR